MSEHDLYQMQDYADQCHAEQESFFERADIEHDKQNDEFLDKLSELDQRMVNILEEKNMDEEDAIVVVEEEPKISLGQMMVNNPDAMVAQAKVVATTLTSVIEGQKLYTIIQNRKYVHVEGWSTLGAMLGVVPRTVSVGEIEPGIFEATVELVNTATGMIVGQGIAECGDSNTWKNRDRYAKKSMAITRATGKAFRLSYSWIIKLAGYEGTPAEEMPGK